tara:strand:- start:2688 stop:3200 length:513 start_codon:yes stop_codon:yes gene_type:complete
MAVGGSNLMNLRDKAKLKRLQGKLDRAQSRLDKVKGGGDSNKKKMFTKQVKDFKNDINAFKKSFGMSTNTGPLKISNKGLTPARTLAKGESKISRATMMGGMPGDAGNPQPKKRKRSKPGFEFLERRGSRLGQMAYGGKVKKMKHGGKTGKCPRDGIAIRGKTKAGRKRA